MRITLLGTGTPAPLPHRMGPATLVTIGDEHLLFDAGRGVTTQLVRAGVALERLGPIFLTHHNYDHINNLGDLLLTAWHAGHRPSLRVVGPQGTNAIVGALLTQVYAREITFTMQLAQAAVTVCRGLPICSPLRLSRPTLANQRRRRPGGENETRTGSGRRASDASPDGPKCSLNHGDTALNLSNSECVRAASLELACSAAPRIGKKNICYSFTALVI